MKLLSLGIILITIGIIFVFISSIASIIKGQKNIESAGGIFIGPIPIFGFASSKRMFYILLTSLAVLFMVNIILRYLK